MSVVGEKIKYLRIEKGLTQTQLAEAAKVTKQTIYKYENNIIENIPLAKVVLIAERLNVDPSLLMGWEISDSIKKNPFMYDLAYVTAERELFQKRYDRLNDAGKRKLSDYLDDLLASPTNTEEGQENEA